jgi:tetratricopeptide (TPR) repeat protein
MQMEKISLCMIVKDEAANIRRCLESVRQSVDEMIVIDTGSSDGTAEIAAQAGAKVFHYSWNNDFSAARNCSLKQASGDWIIFLDADEEFLGSRHELDPLLTDSSVEGYFIKILNQLGSETDEVCPDLVFRLFRNRKEYRFHGMVHEQILDTIWQTRPDGCRIAENISIRHYGYLARQVKLKDKKNRNLRLLVRELEQNPDNRLARYSYGEELYRSKRYREALVELFKAADGIENTSIILPRLFRSLALTFYELGQYEESVMMIDSGLSYFPDYPDLYYLNGLIQFQQKNYKRANQAFLTVLAMSDPPLHYASADGVRGFRALYQLGRISEAHRNDETALEYYTRSCRQNPNFTPALHGLIRLLQPERDPEGCRACLEQTGITAKPGGLICLADALFENSAYSLALKYYESGDGPENTGTTVKIRKAVCLIQQREFGKALALLETVSPSDAEYPVAVFNRLFCYLLLKNPRKFLDLSRTTPEMDLSPDSLKIIQLLKLLVLETDAISPFTFEAEGMALLTHLAERSIQVGEFELTDSLFGTLDPELQLQNHLVFGAIYEKYGYVESAELLYHKAIKHGSSLSETFYKLGKAQAVRGDLLEAINHYRFALGYTLKEPYYYLALLDAYQKLILTVTGDALKLFPEKQPPRSTEAHYQSRQEPEPAYTVNLSLNVTPAFRTDWDRRGQNIQNGRKLKQYQEAASRDPGNLENHYQLGLCWFEFQRYQKAALCFKKVTAVTDHPDPALRTAAVRLLIKCLQYSDQWVDAVGIFMAESKRYPEYAALCFDGGNLFEMRRQYQLAIKWFQKATECGPSPEYFDHTPGADGFLSLYHLGYCHEQLQQYQTARDDYEKALAVNPGFDPALQRLFPLILAEKGSDGAFLHFSSRSASTQYFLNLGQLFFNVGYYRLALDCLKQIPFGSNSSEGKTPAAELPTYQIYAGEARTALQNGRELIAAGPDCDGTPGFEMIIAAIISEDYKTAAEIIRQLWARPENRNRVWATKLLADVAFNGAVRSRPEKWREPEVIQSILGVVEKCFLYLPTAPADEEQCRIDLLRLEKIGITALTRLSPDSARILIGYLKERCAQTEKLLRHSHL